MNKFPGVCTTGTVKSDGFMEFICLSLLAMSCLKSLKSKATAASVQPDEWDAAPIAYSRGENTGGRQSSKCNQKLRFLSELPLSGNQISGDCAASWMNENIPTPVQRLWLMPGWMFNSCGNQQHIVSSSPGWLKFWMLQWGGPCKHTRNTSPVNTGSVQSTQVKELSKFIQKNVPELLLYM